MNLSAAKDTFIIESRELLDEMEHSLLELEKDPSSQDAINAVFRAVHTIKGSSGMFGFNGIVDFTHVAENFLEKVRKGTIKISDDLTAVLLECRDHIAELVDIYAEGDASVPAQLVAKGNEILKRLESFLNEGQTISSKHNEAKEAKEAEEKKDTASVTKTSRDRVENDCWHISLRFGKDVLRNGLDPMAFIGYLKNLGKIINLVTVTDAMPKIKDMNPEECYLGFEIDLETDKTKEDIEQVFEFVENDAQIIIIPPNSSVDEYKMLIENMPETPMRLGEILQSIGSLTEHELEKAMMKQIEKGGLEHEKPLGEILAEEKMVPEAVIDAALEKQKKTAVEVKKSIRIEADKLDNLINQVGELVITVSNVNQLADKNGDKELLEASSIMSRLVEEIRDSAMNVRMVQIGETFKKFERVVRDLSKNLGKKIDLEVSGGDTELDKTVVEKISDPLMHIVRNAVDHGIGMPETRKKAGKPEYGTLSLNAFHDMGMIIIEISDDGEGINKERVLKKAIERGLIAQGQELTDKEIYNLIFEPGFSTAEAVTNVSGRGVGMDVVKKNIEALRGTVDIDSKEGEGTSIRIQLPLTLAIIDGFRVGVGETSYIIPLDMVLECIEITEKDILTKRGGNFVNLRGEVLPFLRLREFFDEEGAKSAHENVIVVRYGQMKAGLVADRLLGEFQTVIKPLGKLFENVHGISGATILGSGEVALILDVPRLVKAAQRIEEESKKLHTAGVA
ncbi:MAG: chemotaxis protein CheA [Spirochaetia bacterium]|nr:chemotaxis protein CheA [Spirochaetia bacterium]